VNARKSSGASDAGAKFESQSQNLQRSHSENHRQPQARLGSRRRLVDGRWVAASPNTALAAALIEAQQIANTTKPRQLLLSDLGIMPNPHKKRHIT